MSKSRATVVLPGHHELNILLLIPSELWQENKDILSNLLDQRISLDPLTAAIKDLTSAAKDAQNEAKVRSGKSY